MTQQGDGACVLGVDIGGTKIAAGVVTARGELLRTVTLPTLAFEPLERSLEQVFAAIHQCLTPEIGAIGICAPGPLNPKTGMVLNPPNLPHWRNVPLAELVRKRFNLPCTLENDANAAGLAEALFGAAQGMDDVLYVTLGTGIGTGIIINRKIYHGKNGAAGEGGHVTVDWRSPVVCNCGVRGCIEALASGSALARRGTSVGAHLDSAERIAAAAAEGDPQAALILEEAVDALSAWLGSLISLLDPEIIVIGGGLAQIGDPLFARLRQEAPRRTINQFAAEIPIVAAHFQTNTGIIGAAAVAFGTRAW